MIEDLKAFVTVIDEASLTRAATALCVTQSAVSKRIQRLEQYLGADLLDRNSKPPRPTAVACRIYEQAVPLLRGLDRLLELAREDAEPTGTLRFGFPQVVAEIALFNAVVMTKERFPLLEVRLRTDWSSALLRTMEQGELDAAVIMVSSDRTPHEDFSRTFVARLEVLVVQSRSKPLVEAVNSIKSLASQEWVLNPQGCGYRAALEAAMDSAGKSLRLGVDTHGTDMQLRLVAAGLGLGLVPRGVLENSEWKDEVSVVEVSDFDLSVDVWLVRPAQLGNLGQAVNFLGESIQASFDGQTSRGSRPA
ncbi:DNA-binding transcriptional LysR family regulator [Paraburkholderia tropica]|uniref:DNA-binding transcriptional LysR family regulator n=1 Tax=Paraburkholderia tropica TaxID=92647 RepID=A0ABX5MBW6_9BURK|nr:LysR family transcriptional regulator [Paraburkholderia tropica]MBB3004690.1 DNA-binding transcriptional LysR family regulator [Paraburkholderia tropica]MBB6323488.1 DNA-binding transcriptional LysR family regulator [Paraburkholderia tropica]PXX05254.1 DNA-binding transcriptional LysR family regulator [Paraburkholderia tropica]PZW70573.1 DNA-binding transcriptional LysR family regulator [Paraburkholderia tropica]QNB17390.1 LysR family transcriptional regulator [Paraburkholderia tropica]